MASRKHSFVEKLDMDGMVVWVYQCLSPPHQKALIRQVGAVTLTVTVQPLLNGKDRVQATTLGGGVVFTKQYGMDEECRLMEFRHEVHAVMMARKKVSPNTQFTFVRGSGCVHV